MYATTDATQVLNHTLWSNCCHTQCWITHHATIAAIRERWITQYETTAATHSAETYYATTAADLTIHNATIAAQFSAESYTMPQLLPHIVLNHTLWQITPTRSDEIHSMLTAPQNCTFNKRKKQNKVSLLTKQSPGNDTALAFFVSQENG